MSLRRPGRPEGVNDDVQAYVDAIPPEHRPLFDRLHGLVLAVCPDAEVRLSYGMPTYVAGRARRLRGPPSAIGPSVASDDAALAVDPSPGRRRAAHPPAPGARRPDAVA